LNRARYPVTRLVSTMIQSDSVVSTVIPYAFWVTWDLRISHRYE
jgi:hypothetical protein